MTKAEELINKHLILVGGTELGIRDGDVYTACLNAVNEALNIHLVSNCDLCNGTGYISVDNMVVECHSC